LLKSSTQLKLGALLSYVAIFVNLVSGLVFTPWMIAKLGQSDYAIYTLAYSLINLFIVDFGLGSAVSRYLSKYKAEGDSQKINNFLGIIYMASFPRSV
jgi:O-antigen/teichoic acid export membrane protein